MYSTLLLLIAPLLVSSFSINSNPITSTRSSTCTHTHNLTPASKLHSSLNNNEIDVSDLNLTIEDFNKPLPRELFSDALTLSGYQSTSRIPSTDDNGCYWVENANDLDITLQIPGLRGQPPAALSVLFSTTTITVTAFGRVVWSVIQMGISDVNDCTFLTEDGAGMVPIIQLSIKKRDEGQRWGGFILQVGEDSIL